LRALPKYGPALLLLALVAAACSDTSPEPASQDTSTTVAAAPALLDRLLVIDAAGNVATMDRTGGAVEVLTDDAGDGVAYFQPTWAPDGSAVAVTRADANRGGFSIVEFDLDAGTRAELATAGNAFYVHWSPDSKRVAYLSTDQQGMGLAIAEFGDGVESDEVDRGQPFYFTWSPTGERLATYIGGQRLEVRDATLDGAPSVVGTPGAFQNPAWTDSGLFYVERVGGADTLVVGETGAEPRSLVRLPAPAIFTAPRSGTVVAIQASGQVDGVSAAYQQTPLLPLNRLVVIDVASGELTRVTDQPVLAHFWDPAGTRLLLLDFDQETAMFRWSLWDGTSIRQLTEFGATQIFVQSYLPFFSQYSLNTSLWSPDGTAFAFAGVVDGESGIFVQTIDGAATKVADGDWVTWSLR